MNTQAYPLTADRDSTDEQSSLNRFNDYLPYALIILQGALIFITLKLSGRFELRFHSDFPSYVDFDYTSLRALISSHRTAPYGLFLKLITLISPDYSLVPVIQYSLQTVVTVFFMRSLIAAKFDTWEAFIVSSPLLYLTIMVKYASATLPDALCVSLSILSISLLMYTVIEYKNLRHWVLLSLAIFATYYTKPMYLFMVVFIPFCGLLLFRAFKPDESKRTIVTIGLRLFAAAFAPFLSICILRFFLVGQFGTVSYAGMHSLAIANQLLTPELIPELDPEVRSLASEIIERRATAETDALYIICRELQFDHEGVAKWINLGCYDRLLKPLLASVVSERHESAVSVNQRLGTLARQVFWHRPILYAKWLCFASLHAVSLLVRGEIIFDILLLTLLVFSALLWLSRTQRSHAADKPLATDHKYFLHSYVLIIIAAGFFLLGVALVVSVQSPTERYITALAVFIPPLLALRIYHTVKMLWAPPQNKSIV